MARFEAAGKKLSPEEKAKRDEHPFDAYARFKAESAKGQFPKGVDNFRWRFHGLFYVAPTQNSYMCRLRIPNGILSHWQFAGVADLAERYGGGYAHVTTRANLQIRDIMPRRRRRPHRGPDEPRPHRPKGRVPTTSAMSPARPQPASTRRSCSTPVPLPQPGIITSSTTARSTACRASSTSASTAAASFPCWRTPTTSPSRP